MTGLFLIFHCHLKHITRVLRPEEDTVGAIFAIALSHGDAAFPLSNEWRATKPALGAGKTRTWYLHLLLSLTYPYTHRELKDLIITKLNTIHIKYRVNSAKTFLPGFGKGWNFWGGQGNILKVILATWQECFHTTLYNITMSPTDPAEA